MHWFPFPEVLYSKAHRGPKLSLLSINRPIVYKASSNMVKISKSRGEITKIVKIVTNIASLNGQICMHWFPFPEVLYSKENRGPKLSLLSINWPIFLQNEVKIQSKLAKIGVKFPKLQNSYQYYQFGRPGYWKFETFHHHYNRPTNTLPTSPQPLPGDGFKLRCVEKRVLCPQIPKYGNSAL